MSGIFITISISIIITKFSYFKNKRFQDLKSGLNYLKENVGSKTANSSDNLLKTNISSFMDAIKIMKGRLLFFFSLKKTISEISLKLYYLKIKNQTFIHWVAPISETTFLKHLKICSKVNWLICFCSSCSRRIKMTNLF